MQNLTDHKGFTLIELVIVIVVLAIIGMIATREMIYSIEDARYQQTMTELDQLALAVTGNAELHDRGVRTDFGYVGDVGALPPDLAALAVNPGYSTWDGPYIDVGDNPTAHLTDAWGSAYVYTGTTIRSVGSGNVYEKVIAASSTSLVDNAVSGFVTDADRAAPGVVYRDSITVTLVYPDGSGGVAAPTIPPASDGSFSFSGIPVGTHTLRIAYVPAADTTTMTLTVLPGRTTRIDAALAADLW